MELNGFTAVLDELTRNTYIMVIIHDPTIGTPGFFHPHLFSDDRFKETAAVRMNIALARPKFEELQADNNNTRLT